MTKKDENVDPNIDGVDMERIKDLMGPLPYEKTPDTPVPKKEKKDSDKNIPTTAPVVKKSDKELNEAAEEINAQLKAMSPVLEETVITKIDDDIAASPEANNAYLAALEGSSDSETSESTSESNELESEGVASDDPTIEKAVDEIVAHESDAILEAEDEKRDSEKAAKNTKPSLRERLIGSLKKPAVLWSGLIIIVIGFIGIGVVPASRYFVLNTVGVRASLGLTVIDSSTLQPLKNVTVSAAGVSATTDSKGTVKLSHLKLGNAKLNISKRAFTTVKKDIVIGWGSNPQGDIRLAASGAQYNFIITDFLSGKTIEKAEISSGDGNAISDKNGKGVLTLDTSGKNDADDLTIRISAENYRTESVVITAGNKETIAVKLVPSRKAVFVSKRSGSYDIYTIDVDGKNEKKIVSGTGIEREEMTLLPMQNSDMAAYVATRENVKNVDGYLMSTLYLLDTKSGSLTKVDQSEQIQVIGWSSDGRLVYAKITAGASAANPKRHRLLSVNSKNVSDNKELATANYFNDIVMAGGRILYAPSAAFTDSAKIGLFSVNADGTNAFTVSSKEIYNIFRTDYESVLANSASTTKYSYKFGAAPSTFAASTLSSTTNRVYVDAVAGGKALWVDKRDGKDMLLLYDAVSKKDVTIVTKNGLKLPAYWLNDTTIVFRVSSSTETADYAVSVNGGEAKKIQDVTNSFGSGRWYYY